MAPHTGELLQEVARVYARTARGDPSERRRTQRSAALATLARCWRQPLPGRAALPGLQLPGCPWPRAEAAAWAHRLGPPGARRLSRPLPAAPAAAVVNAKNAAKELLRRYGTAGQDAFRAVSRLPATARQQPVANAAYIMPEGGAAQREQPGAEPQQHGRRPPAPWPSCSAPVPSARPAQQAGADAPARPRLPLQPSAARRAPRSARP
jgi:hypothetical protein